MPASSSTHRANASGSSVAPRAKHHRHHHLVAGLDVGHAVGHGHHHVGVQADGVGDGAGREVLAVDPDPLGRAAGEVEVAVLVEVAEVAGPVPPVAGGRSGGLRVVVVALEGPGAGGVDDLAHALVRVEQRARRRRSSAGGHSLAVLVDDAGSSDRPRPWPRPAAATSRSTAMPPSVEPKASITSTPKRSANRRAPGGRPRCRRPPARCCRRRRAGRARPPGRTAACRCS